MRGYKNCLFAAGCALVVVLAGQAARGQTAAPVVPLVPGLTLVLAARDTPPAGTPKSAILKNVATGDYEVLVTVTSVSANGIEETTSIDTLDENRKPLQLTVRRRVLAADLANSRLQILGVSTDDPEEIPGTTSLGPSLAVVRDLRTTGHATYSVVPYLSMRRDFTSAGTLTRVGSPPVPFPVLLNGRRVELPAIRVTGLLKYGNNLVKPWEQYILDHPQYPITLRFTYGANGADIGSAPDFTREVVRIDFPPQAGSGATQAGGAIEASLTKSCRVEMPGIYFDVDLATLKPVSNRALTTIAELLRRQPQWRLSIEGHTDNSGAAAHNQDLSTRRAATVRAALVRDFAIAPVRLTSAGFGASRPVETNDTIAGRAHNRRVELVRDCSGKP